MARRKFSQLPVGNYRTLITESHDANSSLDINVSYKQYPYDDTVSDFI